MSRRIFIQIVATVVVATFAAGIWLSGDTIRFGWLRFFSVAVLVASVILWLWDHVIWKFPIIQKLPGVPRDIGGTWRGVLESFWIDPRTNERVSPKPAYL